ncbi:rod shape-determining protein MreC [Crocinitomicaceae bacterium]|nr:rod shape-determining protein MreC [Crocinitomicaceae bacterium]
MRNFLAFIRRFRVLLLFALLQGLALTMYFRYLSFPRSQYMTTASYVSGSVFEITHNITQYLNLKKNNTALQKENVRLRSKLPENLLKLDRESIAINDTLYKVQYEYIPARVINSTYTKRNNYFTIDIGSSQKVERGMGVISSKGVIGVIQNVSEHFAVVRSCLTEKVRIAAMIESTGEHGFIDWKGKSPKQGTLTGISNDTKVKKWAAIVTRGSAGIFPQGIPIGKILNAKTIEGKPLWDITLLFAENFRTVQRVYVVKNKLSKEQTELEANLQTSNL